MEEFHDIPSSREIPVYEWSDPCPINSLRDTVYFPAGLGVIGVLNIRHMTVDTSSKTKSAEITFIKDVITRHSVFDIQLTSDNKSLIIDQGARSIRVVNVQTGQTFEEHFAHLINEGIISKEEGLAFADSPTNLMWRLQNDMSPVSRIQPKKEETDDQPTFTDIQLDVREETSTMSGLLRP